MRIENSNHGVITLKAEIKFNNKIAAYGEQKCIIMNIKTGKMDKEKVRFILNDVNE